MKLWIVNWKMLCHDFCIAMISKFNICEFLKKIVITTFLKFLQLYCKMKKSVRNDETKKKRQFVVVKNVLIVNVSFFFARHANANNRVVVMYKNCFSHFCCFFYAFLIFDLRIFVTRFLIEKIVLKFVNMSLLMIFANWREFK